MLTVIQVVLFFGMVVLYSLSLKNAYDANNKIGFYGYLNAIVCTVGWAIAAAN